MQLQKKTNKKEMSGGLSTNQGGIAQEKAAQEKAAQEKDTQEKIIYHPEKENKEKALPQWFA